jgi:uncharacterized protein
MRDASPISSVQHGALLAGAVALLLSASGCTTYQEDTNAFTQAIRGGGLMAAIPQIEQQVAKAAGGKDEIVYRLEHGGTLWTAVLADPSMVPSIIPPAASAKMMGSELIPNHQPEPESVQTVYALRCIEAFDRAEHRINYWEEQARVMMGAEVGAALTNQANLPYRGRAYDKVMMNTYKALTYLVLGEKDKARVELNRALQRQRDAVAENQERIARARDEAAAAARGQLRDESGNAAAYDSRRALADPRTGPMLQATLQQSVEPLRPYGDYVNPFSVFIDGLFFTALGETGDDWERGRKSFSRLASMVPENPYLRDDLEAATRAAEGEPPEGVTYVIFETGTAPSRDQVRIEIPTFLVSSRLAYITAAFPKLVFHDNYISTLTVATSGQVLNTATIASMDSVVANDFKNEWPVVVTKTLISTATKAIIQAAVQKEVEEQSGMVGGLFAAVAMTAINSLTSIADTRTWTSLPKEFQYARLRTPADRELTVSAFGAQKTLTLGDGSVNIVYVKSTSPTSPLLASQFVLK